MAILGDDVARGIERVEPVELRLARGRRPARVERIERPCEGQRLARAIVEARALERSGGPAIEEMVVAELERGAVAIDRRASFEAERRAGAGEVGLLDVDRAGGLAALVAQL